MMRSLFSAVSGLKAHQTKMDVIGNNIANVNTVAFKAQSVTFSDVYYQTTQTATGPNATSGKGGTNAKQIGLGSSVGAISTAIESQGATERTDNPWDLCITGDSFFIVNSAGNTYFTRSGDFKADLNGALVTQSGANVMGWKCDENGQVIKDKVQPLYVTSPEYMYTEPMKTTAVSVTGNVDARSTSDSVFTINFYDSVGNEYQASLTLRYANSTTGTGATQPIASYSILGGTVTKNGEPTGIKVSVDANSAINSMQFNTATGAAVAGMGNIKLSLSGASAQDKIDVGNIGVANGTGGDSTLTLDASGITMYADATNLKGVVGIKNDNTGIYEGAGKPVGKMTSVGVDEAGQIVASYSNGDTKAIGQIAVTSFANPAGLEKVGDNMYAATLNSGMFDGIGEDITEADGSISSGYLEMSNVDLADQFTSMITTQRGYQANSRIITVSDNMLEELINLKR